jgi:hypothetical protein
MYATTDESLSVLHRGVWILVYGGTFFAAVVLPVTYLTGMRSLVIDLKNRQTKNKG